MVKLMVHGNFAGSYFSTHRISSKWMSFHRVGINRKERKVENPQSSQSVCSIFIASFAITFATLAVIFFTDIMDRHLNSVFFNEIDF